MANFAISGARDGRTYKYATDGKKEWRLTLPSAQDYEVLVSSATPTEFSLLVVIESPPHPSDDVEGPTGPGGSAQPPEPAQPPGPVEPDDPNGSTGSGEPLAPLVSLLNLLPAVPNLCNRVLEEGDDLPYWAVSTTEILLNDPGVEEPLASNTLWVQACGMPPESAVSISLQGIKTSTYLSPFPGDDAPQYYYYTFPVDSPQGMYTLQIESGSQILRRNIYVVDYLEDFYAGVYFYVRNQQTGDIQTTVQPGQTVRIDYRGSPRLEVETKLYGTDPSIMDMLVMIDSWHFVMDDYGEYSELLVLPSAPVLQNAPYPARFVLVTDFVEPPAANMLLIGGNPHFIERRVRANLLSVIVS